MAVFEVLRTFIETNFQIFLLLQLVPMQLQPVIFWKMR